jgi:hypothetical protein
MNQSKLRIIIFSLWVAFWIISSVVMIVSPYIRKDIETADIIPAIYNISGIWIPALSLLAAFWFSQKVLTRAKNKLVPKEKIFGALSVTCVYLLFVLGLILYSTFAVVSNVQTPNPEDINLLSQIGQSVKLSLLASPIALAPINWLTGG